MSAPCAVTSHDPATLSPRHPTNPPPCRHALSPCHQAVGDGTGIKPIYEVQMEIKGLPFLQPQPEAFMRHITAKECCGRPPVTFNRVEKVRAGSRRPQRHRASGTGHQAPGSRPAAPLAQD